MKTRAIWLVLAAVSPLAAVAAEPRCPLIPMGAITGKPDEQTVKQTLEAYQAVGVDQYLIYPRSGLEYEYLGDEWLQMCQWFCQHARRLDMSIWLYDEYNWPSGSCKGRVPAENPDFESRQYAVYKNADGTFRWQVVHSPGWADNYSFPAMQRFIELTHKRYEQRLGPYLGTTIVGIFTDEPAHPTPATLDRKPDLLFRYFDGAEAEYKAATGRELRADVQAYLADKTKDEMWAVYYGLLGQRFRQAYFDPIRAWCDRVGILATGHMISENSTSNSALYNGNPLHALKGLTLPGMDEIGTRYDPASIEWLTLAVAQHAAGRRGQGGLVELFALGPSDLRHATHRQMIWLCAMHKIDRYVLAIAPIDARGNVEKSGYFNPLTRMQPWFPAFRLLGDESRVAARYASKPVRCQIAVRYPQREAARLAAKRQAHPALLATLRRFSAAQLTYDLYEEDEPCDKPLVFALEGAVLKEEQSGRRFNSPDEAAAFAKTVCPPAVWVENTEGNAVEDVLLRQYEDGSVVVLGLTANEHGKLRLMRRGGQPVPFELPARGVFRFEGQTPEPATPVAVRSVEPDTSFEIALSAVNTHRLAFGKDNQARITVGQPVAAARIVVRNHPAPSTLTLDGKPVRADQPCNTLRPGLNELYRQSEPLGLDAGEHVLAIQAGGSDTNYFLPLAWLAGVFAVDSGTIKTLPSAVGAGSLWKHGLADFAGQVTYTAQVKIPDHTGDVQLRLDTGGLYTSVALDGQALGERAWAPFEWTIPAGVRGKKAELKISVWTSVAPMFGDWKNPNAAWNKNFWVPPPDPRPEIGLLSAPEWMLF
ncbi:MAG: penicillin acylase family protein [Candidatus Anammoximicrobium sp.]|nr:penicillin acylase family protein [Candidatus Anammoximicrobium sp.]